MSEHAPIGAKVRIITEGFGVHGHNLAIGDEGTVTAYVVGWAKVEVPGKRWQVLDPEDYEVIS